MENKIWFTSDPHFGHKAILHFCDRPFKSVTEMDCTLVENWNSVVSPKDDVYLLGDVSFARTDRTYDLLNALNGQIFLIKGNHDKGVVKGKCNKRFTWIKDMYELSVPDEDANNEKQKIVLCHFPMLTWNKVHYGSWNLHGHCHGNLPDDPCAYRLDVGVDCHGYHPISYEEVKGLMSKKTFKPVDHHGAD